MTFDKHRTFRLAGQAPVLELTRLEASSLAQGGGVMTQELPDFLRALLPEGPTSPERQSDGSYSVAPLVLPALPDGFFYDPPDGGLFKRGIKGRPDLRITGFPFALIDEFFDESGRCCVDFVLKLPHAPWKRFTMAFARALAGGLGPFGHFGVTIFSAHGLREYIREAFLKLQNERPTRIGRRTI